MFSYQGEFWSYKDVAMWPRPVQQPHPPIWMPVVGSKESIEFAARHNMPITPGLALGGLQDDIIRYYAQCLAQARPPDHARSSVARHQRLCRRQQGAGGAARCGPYHLYFNRTLFSHGNFTETAMQRRAGYSTHASTDYVRPENLPRRRNSPARISAT